MSTDTKTLRAGDEVRLTGADWGDERGELAVVTSDAFQDFRGYWVAYLDNESMAYVDSQFGFDFRVTKEGKE